jgi:tRNA(Ile)-lysidine synthase
MKRPGTRQWKAAAASLGTLIAKEVLHPGVVEWADSRPKAERWAVALSGGADSVGLLLLLWAHWPERRGRLTAFHFNHRLRGAASDGDARFCGSLCKALAVPLVSGRWEAGQAQRSEAAARQARFAFIEPAMSERRTHVLWLGHQQDDIAESMIMRLSRGSGSAGLAAPRPIHSLPGSRRPGKAILHVRPLLTLKKAEISNALREAGGAWREDASNAKDVHFRNRVRSGVIPAWVAASQRDALGGAALSRELLEEDNHAIETWLGTLDAFGPDGSLDTAKLKGKPRALVRRALHHWLQGQKNAGECSRQAFSAMLRSVELGSPVRHSLGSHGFAVIRSGRLLFQNTRKACSPH